MNKHKFGMREFFILLVIALSAYTVWPSIQVHTKKGEEQKAFLKENPKLATRSINFGLDLAGGTSITLQIDPSGLKEDDDIKDIQAQSLEIIRNRVDQYGLSEPQISPSGDDRILVELAGVDDSTAKSLVGSTAKLEFKILAESEKFNTTLTLIDQYLTRQTSDVTAADSAATDSAAVKDSTVAAAADTAKQLSDEELLSGNVAAAEAPKAEDSSKTEETEESKTEIDTQLLEFLKQRLKPVSADVTTIVPTKVTASELSHKTVGYQFAAVKTPDFDISSDFSAAMKGTAAHNFVEYADFNVIKDEGGIQSEIERIIKDGYMTKDEAALIDNDSIRAFVDSRLFSRIINSKAVYREKEFTVNIPIDLFMQIPEGYVSNSADNETMLQGAMDCIFEEDDGLVIVDYKTDRVKTPHELIKRHAPQLRLYREAAVRIFEKPVKALYIYSFHLGQEIEVPLTDK